MNRQNQDVYNELTAWAAQQGGLWRVERSPDREDYRLWKGDFQVLYCEPRKSGWTSAAVHSADHQDLRPFLPKLQDQTLGKFLPDRPEGEKGVTRLRIYPGEMTELVEWNKERLGL